MMNELLCKYLSLHEEVALSKLGVFHKNKYPASINNTNDTILPPVETLLLRANKEQKTDSAFIGFIVENLNIPISDAAEKAERFIEKIVSSLQKNKEAAMVGLGTLYQKQSHIHFVSVGVAVAIALYARQVSRQDTTHLLRVGEKEVSNVEMKAFLEQQPSASIAWMYWIIGILSAVFLYLLYRYLQ